MALPLEIIIDEPDRAVPLFVPPSAIGNIPVTSALARLIALHDHTDPEELWSTPTALALGSV
jgi:hypothetical protein